MSTYAFGDIQGCYSELQNLLGIIEFDESLDELWFVGDLINRGPNNVETLDFIMSLPHARIVLGNHDLHFLAVATGCHEASPKDTFTDLLEHPKLQEYVDWYRTQPLLVHDELSDCIMVHAGIPPIWNLSTCLERAREVEEVLRGANYQSFLKNMYGNEPAQWSDELNGDARLRIITNFFTRMRFTTTTGTLELKHKTKQRPPGYAPWFEHLSLLDDKLTVLFGHWAALDGVTNIESRIGLDTGCIWGRRLSAYRIEDKRPFTTPAIARSPNSKT
ncbi:MAG: symmetrical bis(5'-nucleosyl)-tetraphosphatase [Pseudomonadales bacterium]